MRKIIILIGFLFLYLNIFSRNVPVDTAELVAKNNFDMIYPSASHIVDKVEIGMKDQDTCFYFICFKDSGWCIVSATYLVRPILAYNQNGSIEIYKNQNSTFAWIIDNIKANITNFKNTNTKDSNAVVEWYNLTQFTNTSTKLKSFTYYGQQLIKAEWNQGKNIDDGCDLSYNMYFEKADFGGDCGKYFAGCAAVAMGQIMWYWKWPSHSFYHSYDWDIMDVNINNGSESAHAQETAKLLVDLARIANSMYSGELGTGAYLTDVESAFKQMQYNVDWHKKSSYKNEDDWWNAIKDEINNGRPVFLKGGFAYWNQHYFICDGVQGDNFHYNLGYGKTQNIWTNSLGYIKPSYDNDMYMLSNIYPKCDAINDIPYSDPYNPYFDQSPFYSKIDRDIKASEFIHYQGKTTVVLPEQYYKLTIEDQGKSIMNADESVTLKPGFWAKPGSDFHAKTVQCGSCRYLNSSLSILKSDYVDNLDYSTVSEVKEQHIEPAKETITVSPNPSNGNYLIKNLPNNVISLKVYNNIGIIVYLKTNVANPEFVLNISDEPSGIYFLIIESSNKSVTLKLEKR